MKSKCLMDTKFQSADKAFWRLTDQRMTVLNITELCT